MPEPIRMRLCPRCHTAIDEDLAICPECGAARVPQDGGPPAGAGIFGGGRGDARALTGPLLRRVLAERVGCLLQALLVVFGLPLLLGLLAGNALAGLGVALLVEGLFGLALTALLVWLVWPARGGPRR
ncbi:MAG: hypothetical protein ACC662_11905 [Planctomycetota bacterium]